MDNPKLLILVTILLWSFGVPLGRLISIESQYLLLALTYWFSFLFFLLYSLISYKGVFFSRLQSMKKRHLVYGSFGYFFCNIALNKCFRSFDSASEATLLNYTWPVFTIIFTKLFFGEEIKQSKVVLVVEGLGVLLGFLAVVILLSEGDIGNLDVTNYKGVFWGILGGASYGLFSSYSRTVAKEEQCMFLLASIAISLFLMTMLSLLELSIIETLSINSVMITIARGIFISGIAYATWTRANRIAFERNINVSSLASIMFILPLISLIWVALMFKETLIGKAYYVASLLLIVSSSVFCQKPEQMAKLLTHKS